MRKLYTLLFILLVGSLNQLDAQNIVTNGDFESWSGGMPDGWTTIDAGIVLNQETTIVYGGNSSASIDVTTTSQDNTDLRQDVSVSNATQYDVSVWVYHTEGHLKARLYVDGYQSYSDNTFTGSWQEMTFSFTASADEVIEVGLRFYDQSGFDGSEIVYVDDFVITPASQVIEDTLYFESFDADLGSTSQYNVTGNDQVWEWATFGVPAGCAKMSGFDGSAFQNEDWLITPAINMTNFIDPVFNFWHARNFADNSGLSVRVCTDYDGTSDPTQQGSWTDLTPQFTFPSTGSWNFIDAGTIDVSAYSSSNTYFAFVYESTDTDAATWEIDKIKVSGEQGSTVVRIVGDMNGWNTTDPNYVCTLNANGVYELTKNLAAGSYGYKALEGDDWGAENYPANNQTVSLSSADNVTWKVNVDANLVTHLTPVLAGNFFSASGLGSDWDPTNLNGEMMDADGDDVFEVSILVPQGYWECKVTLNRNWDQSTGGNTPFVSNGADATVFTYDMSNNTTTASGPNPDMTTVTFTVYDTNDRNYSVFYLKGSWDDNGFYDPGWGGGIEHATFVDDGTNGDLVAGDHIWTAQQDLVVDYGTNTWQWGVNDPDHNWIDGNFPFSIVDENPILLEYLIPDQPDLVINEIMYNSIGNDEEWVELYNNTDQTIDLENYYLLDSDASHDRITFPAGYSIEPGAYFTVSVATNGAFPFTPDYDGTGNFALNNSGDQVRIFSPANILVDFVEFTDQEPWPTAADGDGPSLSLLEPFLDNKLPQNWAASQEEGGTPGGQNFIPVPFISVTSPNGGELIEQSETFEITWNYGFWETAGSVDIDLYREGQNPEAIAINVDLAAGSFMWTVFNDQALGDDYKIIISDHNGMVPADSSDQHFSIVEPYVAAGLVITEIMYNPPEMGTDSLEFIEIYNNSEVTVNLMDFYFSEGVEYIFPAVELLPDAYFLVAIDSLAFVNTYGVSAYQWTAGALSNGGELIELRDNLGFIIDSVPYDDQLPWDTLADGHGPSLTLCNPDVDNAQGENWTHSINFITQNADNDSIFATPGSVCAWTIQANFQASLLYVPEGDSTMFTDQSIGNLTSWQWIFDGGEPATFNGQQPPHITYNNSGDYDVTLIVSDGTTSDTLTKTAYIHTGLPPVVDFEAEFTTLLAGTGTVFFNMSSGTENTYSWTFYGGFPENSNETNPEVLYEEAGLYSVELISTNPYGSDTLEKTDYINVIPVGLEEAIPDELILFPNPFTNRLTISNFHDHAACQVAVYNMQGELMQKYQQQTDQLDMNLQHLTAGIYLLHIHSADGSISLVKKIIKQ